MQLVHHSQWKSERTMLSGSTNEIPFGPQLAMDYFNVNVNYMDVDIMIYSTSRYAFHRSASLPESYNGSVIRIYSDVIGLHTGYVWLIQEKNNSEQMRSDLYTLRRHDRLHGPAVLSDNKVAIDMANLIASHTSDVDDIEEFRRMVLVHTDHVYAVHNPYWPVEAIEFIRRRRPHKFPAKSVIKQIVRYGCDFVQVSHKLSRPYSNEWRFSFSKAELLIAKSRTISQKTVFFTLWVINKTRIANSNLCSYYFKTLMFWAYEEKPTNFWRDDTSWRLLLYTVCELLIVMITWVKSKFCPNYFIPGNNMMDHLIDTDLSYEIDALWKTLQSNQFISQVLARYMKYDVYLALHVFRIETPSFIKRAYVIYNRVNREDDNYTDLFDPDLTIDLQKALYIELSDIYRGLCFQKKSITSDSVSDKHMYLLKSENHLLLAISLCESPERDVIENFKYRLVETMTGDFRSCGLGVSCEENDDENVQSNCPNVQNTKRKFSSDRQNSANGCNEHKCLLYSRSVEKHETEFDNIYLLVKCIESSKSNSALNNERDVSTSKNIVEFFKKWPGHSPTVNISWFIAKAYLANLYYTTERDVSDIEQTCDDIIRVFRQSPRHKLFAERTFPVVLSTQLTSIYDKEIQALLGFHSLCSYVSDKGSSRSVYLGVCPVLFAHYVKVRTAKEDPLLKSTLKCINDYIEHIIYDECGCDKRVNNGLLTLMKAYYIGSNNYSFMKSYVELIHSLEM